MNIYCNAVRFSNILVRNICTNSNGYNLIVWHTDSLIFLCEKRRFCDVCSLLQKRCYWLFRKITISLYLSIKSKDNWLHCRYIYSFSLNAKNSSFSRATSCFIISFARSTEIVNVKFCLFKPGVYLHLKQDVLV